MVKKIGEIGKDMVGCRVFVMALVMMLVFSVFVVLSTESAGKGSKADTQTILAYMDDADDGARAYYVNGSGVQGWTRYGTTRTDNGGVLYIPYRGETIAGDTYTWTAATPSYTDGDRVMDNAYPDTPAVVAPWTYNSPATTIFENATGYCGWTYTNGGSVAEPSKECNEPKLRNIPVPTGILNAGNVDVSWSAMPTYETADFSYSPDAGTTVADFNAQFKGYLVYRAAKTGASPVATWNDVASAGPALQDISYWDLVAGTEASPITGTGWTDSSPSIGNYTYSIKLVFAGSLNVSTFWGGSGCIFVNVTAPETPTATATGPTGYSNTTHLSLAYDYANDPSFVELYYTTDDGATWNSAVNDTVVNGSVDWTAPGEGEYGWFAVAIGGDSTETAPEDGVDTPEASSLIIDTTIPAVSSTTPEKDAMDVSWNQNVVVTFNDSMNTSVTPDLQQTDGTSSVTYTFSGWSTTTVADDTATWAHNDWDAEDSITLSVSNAKDKAGNSLSAAYSWSFTTASGATATAIGPTEVVSNNPVQTITYDYSSSPAPDSVKLYYSNDSGAHWYFITEETTPDGSYVWDMSDKPDGEYYWNAMAIGGGSTEAVPTTSADIEPTPSASPFVLDTAAPEVLSTVPVNGATDVPRNQNVVVVFNESMNTSVELTLLQQTAGTDPDGWAGPTWSTTTVADDTATWTHNDWAASDSVTLNVSDAKDKAGNPISVAYVWSFDVIAKTAPTVTTNDATGFTDTGATLKMLFTVGDYSPVSVWFNYRVIGATSWIPTDKVSKSDDGSYSKDLSDLATDTDYEFKGMVTYGSTDMAGVTKNFALHDTTPPVFAGLQSAEPGDGCVDLSWNAATDTLSPPITYLIYQAEGPGEEDFTTATYTTAETSYHVSGLTNGLTYYFVVRARDNAATPNVDTNTLEKSATPDAVGWVCGKVTEQNYNPIEGATVTVLGTSYYATTDASGEYIISGVPPGTYTVIVNKTGYIPITEENVVVTAAHGTGNIDFVLELPTPDSIGISTSSTSFVLTDSHDMNIGDTWVLYCWAGNTTAGWYELIDVSWTATTGIGSVSPASGSSTTFTGTKEGTGVVTATYGSLGNDTGVISVSDIEAPVFAGLQNVEAGNGYVDLNWDAASDDTPPITYLIYQAEGPGEEDFTTATYTTAETSYRVSGLTNGNTYYFVVRARDNSTNKNIDTNTVEKSATPSAEGWISGMVTDENILAYIEGATVTVVGTSYYATTEASGEYIISGVPPGTYTVIVNKTGYKPATEEVEVTAAHTTTADFVLEKKAADDKPGFIPSIGIIGAGIALLGAALIIWKKRKV